MNATKPLASKLNQRNTRQAERQLNVVWLPVLAGVFSLAYLLTSYKGWLAFALGTGGAWLMAVIWSRSLRLNLHIERRINLPWATVGESVPEQVKLTNLGWLPALWVEITDDTSSLEKPLRIVADVGRHASRSRQISHLFKQRGLYHLGPTRIRCSDPLGVYTVTLHDQQVSTILVTPPLIPVHRLNIIPGGWAGDEGPSRSRLSRDIRDVGVRDYQPGDSLRRIHWRASAHFDRLIVRQLEASSSRDWHIYVDLDRSGQAGSGLYSTLEFCIVLAASLAVRGLQERRRVGMALAGPNFFWFEPSSNPSQRWRILRAMALANAGDHSLSNLLSLNRPMRTGTSIFITPSSDPSWVAQITRHQNNQGVVAVLVNPRDFGSHTDQTSVTSALAASRIPFIRAPGSWLEEAYAITSRTNRRTIGSVETGKRYLGRGRSDWQNIG